MSILGKKWIIQSSDEGLPIKEQLLKNRQFDEEKDNLNSFFDPYLFTDMEKAVKIIDEAIEKKERIIIFGDYDVDGISGTAILVSLLNDLGAEVSFRIPNRKNDGYGVSKKFIDEFKDKNVKILITVDCGISSINEIALAKEYGIKTIITDHHTIPPKAPDADAIIHPKYDKKYPYSDLTGSGVAFKLAHALIMKHFPKEEWEEKHRPFTDLASLGTVADMGPIRGENRLIVKKGLVVLNRTKWVGLKKIMELASIKSGDDVDTFTIGYKIGPRINAAGRIGDPYIALKLLLQDHPSEKVNEFGQKLETLNETRQQMTYETLNEAELFYKSQRSDGIIISYSKDWNAGILGLVAGRMTEKYQKPSIIMQDLGDTLVASARSPKYFNITEALSELKDYLIAFGGHAQAAGFSIKKEKLRVFEKKMKSLVRKKLANVETQPIINIDCELKESHLTMKTITEIDELKPFGIGFPEPVFMIKGVKAYFVSLIGKEKNHIKFSIKNGDKDIHVIGFNIGEHLGLIKNSNKLDLVFSLSVNKWRNNKNIQLKILDFRAV